MRCPRGFFCPEATRFLQRCFEWLAALFEILVGFLVGRDGHFMECLSSGSLLANAVTSYLLQADQAI